MEQRRFQVFVSSTFLDLQEERAAVVSALLQLESFPAGMELFPAADEDAWTLIKRVIDDSDYYLMVIGGKYGSVDPDTEISYTEKEYDYAVEQGKPVMAFLHRDPDKIELGKSEKDEATRKKLEDFRAKVQATKHVKYWEGPENLAGQVALSFADFRQRYPAVGWVRGDTQASPETLSELNELRKQVAEMEKEQADQARTGPPPEASGLAQGDDQTGFNPTYYVYLDLVDIFGGRALRGRIAAAMTWNDLFAAIGPVILDEASEPAIRKTLQGWLKDEFGGEVRRLAESSAAENGETITGFSSLELDLTDQDFGTLIVQLRALGLIAKSERPRSVKDTRTYWTITPYGDDRLTTLMAIRREPEKPSPTDGTQATPKPNAKAKPKAKAKPAPRAKP
jgi:hypothetical protein